VVAVFGCIGHTAGRSAAAAQALTSLDGASFAL
jgi:hypothetical protein